MPEELSAEDIRRMSAEDLQNWRNQRKARWRAHVKSLRGVPVDLVSAQGTRFRYTGEHVLFVFMDGRPVPRKRVPGGGGVSTVLDLGGDEVPVKEAFSVSRGIAGFKTCRRADGFLYDMS
ncbi:MAG: hypothetical protein CMJ33_09290 [Phycisphaerae bacterium]|nr:hypothetical protein [Phycisphaerae bacterium]